MRLRSSSLAALSASVLLSLGLLSGCGGDEKSPSGEGEASAAADSGEELTQDNFASTIGAAMVESGSAHVTLKSTGGLPIEAEGDQVIGESNADSAASLTMSFSGQQFEMRLLDQKVYFNMGSLTQNKFAEIDLSDTDNPVVQQFGPLAEQTDLAKQFESFGDAVTKFEKTGSTEKIDGVDAQPYEITVDAKKVLEASGQGAAAQTQGMPESFTYTFFLGPDNLVRRLAVDVMGQNVTMDFTDWGKKVDVEKPADSEISDVDLSKLMGGAAVPE